MSSTMAPTISLDAKRPSAPARPSPSRTPYRPAQDTTFSAALRSAANEALAARYASPSAAQIGAPRLTASASDGSASAADSLLGADDPGPGRRRRPAVGKSDARLDIPAGQRHDDPGLGQPTASATPARASGQADMTAMSNRAEQLDPATLAAMPGFREASQAFLSSIKGSDQTAASEYDNVGAGPGLGLLDLLGRLADGGAAAAGQDVKIADVMKAMPGGMTIKLGLVSRPSLVNAANQFGARATDDVTSYDALKQATDNGQPVLVDIRNAKFPEGHWIVVTGVDDERRPRRRQLSLQHDLDPKGDFMRSWSGRGIRLEGLTPTAAPARATTQSA